MYRGYGMLDRNKGGEIMENLRIPGPTPCPDDVLKAMTKQMINHRGEEFGQILNGITANLKQLFQTKNDVLLLTASGTGGGPGGNSRCLYIDLPLVSSE